MANMGAQVATQANGTKAVTCNVTAIGNGTASSAVIQYPDTASYSCNDGFSLVSNGMSICTKDGNLASVPYCDPIKPTGDTGDTDGDTGGTTGGTTGGDTGGNTDGDTGGDTDGDEPGKSQGAAVGPIVGAVLGLAAVLGVVLAAAVYVRRTRTTSLTVSTRKAEGLLLKQQPSVPASEYSVTVSSPTCTLQRPDTYLKGSPSDRPIFKEDAYATLGKGQGEQSDRGLWYTDVKPHYHNTVDNSTEVSTCDNSLTRDLTPSRAVCDL
ncbi:uncharacterized protein LOC135827661 [Sycon ciliatum]|uniref:uncharacterized protein LOC135827661 n=1 Tax=Sycon ciliatum TaxID=27933 RepID=UPI0031F6D0C3